MNMQKPIWLVLMIFSYVAMSSTGSEQMQLMSFSYAKTSLVSNDELMAAGQKLEPEIERIKQAIADGGYQNNYASINLPADAQLRDAVQLVVDEKKALRPTTLVVVGIGGSNLGTKAIHEALYGTYYNEQKPEVNIYFADTVDTDYIYDIVLLCEQELEKGNNIIINVVTKSGSTTETIANFEVFLYLLKQAKKEEYKKYIVVTTDEGSRLWKFAQREGFTCLAVPKNVGGRYSVLSAVGLFPLALLGVNTFVLHKGAQNMLPACTNNDILNNPAALSAAILYIHYLKGVNIHDTFLFSVDLQGIGQWYRQLMAESIGKKVNTAGQEVHVGITPTVSIGSNDLHSVAQLYLGGPYDKVTSFISVEKHKSKVTLARYNEFEKLVAKIQGKPLSSIMDAILAGTSAAYYKNKRPFISITLPEKSTYCIGQFLQFKMMEIMYLGYLLDVNPFDQPQVELYKKETREILAHE